MASSGPSRSAREGDSARTDAVGTVLGFDFGTQRIGVATGQGITGTAHGLTILPARDGKPDWQAVTRLLEQWRPEALVVGLPLNMDGSEQELTRLARRFGRQLAGRYNLPVYEMDERLTSVEARRELGRPHQSDGVVDEEAARIILECWLAERREPEA